MYGFGMIRSMFLTEFNFIDVLICAAVVLIAAFVVYILIRRRSKKAKDENRIK